MSQFYRIAISAHHKKLCSFEVRQQPRKTTMFMKMYSQKIHTSSFPQTTSLLEKFLPSIHLSTCFNDENIPFAKEAKNTEIGHLFEHIFLIYLYKLKLAQGYTNASRGETTWNWEKYPKGTFCITINTGYANKKTFQIAFKKSIELLLRIIDNHKSLSDYSIAS